MGDAFAANTDQLNQGEVLRCFEEMLAARQLTERLRFNLLRSSLLRLENPELNTDRTELLARAASLGFSGELADTVEKIEQQLRTATGAIDFKLCMDLIRSALEAMLQQSSDVVAARTSFPAPTPGARGIQYFASFKEYLTNRGVLTAAESQFLQSLYSYLSNEGSHRLGSTEEQVRVSKNTMIEWSLMLLGRVQQLKQEGQ
jgi:hypothetical protein